MWVLLTCSSCVHKNVYLVIVVNALITGGAAGGIDTMEVSWLLQIASFWFSSISFALILYHWCMFGVMM